MTSFIVLILFSALSFGACPTLQGTYPTCTTSSGAPSNLQNIIVTQQVISGIDVYDFTSTYMGNQVQQNVIADGVLHYYSLPNPTGNPYVVESTVDCTNGTLNVNSKQFLNGTLLETQDVYIQMVGSTYVWNQVNVNSSGTTTEDYFCN